MFSRQDILYIKYVRCTFLLPTLAHEPYGLYGTGDKSESKKQHNHAQTIHEKSKKNTIIRYPLVLKPHFTK